jgi:hypothetical protein
VARVPWVIAGYGTGHVLGQVMDNLRVNEGIEVTTVYTMNPDEVAESFRDNEIVVRATKLDDISEFDASGRNGLSIGISMRGVLKDSGEGSASTLDTLVR